MDDIIVAGDESTHDERLIKFLERASTQGLKLNGGKCKIRQREVPYVGHLLTREALRSILVKLKLFEVYPRQIAKKTSNGFSDLCSSRVGIFQDYLMKMHRCESWRKRTYCFTRMNNKKQALKRSSNFSHKHQSCSIMMFLNR